MALSKLGTEVESTLSIDALDAINGGARLMLPGGAELEIDGTSFENGASRIFNDAYQYYFPNAASNRVQDALQQREIRDAQSDLREMQMPQQMPMQMPEYSPMGEAFGGYAQSPSHGDYGGYESSAPQAPGYDTAPAMDYAPDGYVSDFG